MHLILIDQTGTGKIILNTASTGINVQSGTGETRFTKSGADSEIKIDDSSQASKVVLKQVGFVPDQEAMLVLGRLV